MERIVSLTTVDNPFDQFTDFDNWYKFDTQKGYNSFAYLARIAKVSDAVSDDENDREIENAVDSIVQWNPLLYRKVVKNSEKAPVT